MGRKTLGGILTALGLLERLPGPLAGVLDHMCKPLGCTHRNRYTGRAFRARPQLQRRRAWSRPARRRRSCAPVRLAGAPEKGTARAPEPRVRRNERQCPAVPATVHSWLPLCADHTVSRPCTRAVCAAVNLVRGETVLLDGQLLLRALSTRPRGPEEVQRARVLTPATDGLRGRRGERRGAAA